MQYKIGRRKKARKQKAWVPRLPIQDELIMVPAKPGADCPISQPDQILHKSRLLQVRAIRQKAESRRSAGIKLGGICNSVSEILVQENIVGLDSEFPFVPAVNRGDGALEIPFAKPIVLKNFYGSRIRVGVEIVGIVADHCPEIGHHAG